RWSLLQLTSIPLAPPVGNGDPATGVSPPCAEMLYMDTVPAKGRATARKLPSRVTLIPAGIPAVLSGNGDPAPWVRAPFAAMLYTVFDAPFAAIKNLSSGVTANEIPPPPAMPPVANGEPGTGVRTPVVGSTEKALTSLLKLLPA